MCVGRVASPPYMRHSPRSPAPATREALYPARDSTLAKAGEAKDAQPWADRARAGFGSLKGKGRQHSDSPAEPRSRGLGAETTPLPVKPELQRGGSKERGSQRRRGGANTLDQLGLVPGRWQPNRDLRRRYSKS